MANNPKKSMDPTEAALSAIQDALGVREEKPATEESAAPVSAEPEVIPDLRRNPPRSYSAAERPRNAEAAEVDEELFAEPVRPSRVEEPVSRRPAANDDRQSIGQILQAMQRRPSRMSYTAATIFSAAWLVAGIGLAWT